MFRSLPPMIQPDVWTLAFHRTSPWWWVRLLAFGKYKHVSAFAWVPALGLWLYYDIRLAGTELILLPDSPAATAWLAREIADADLIRVKRATRSGRMPIIAPFYCVPAIRHLIGLRSGALRCDALYRDVLDHGGELIDGRAGTTDTAVAQPGTVAAAGAGSD